MSGQSCAQTTRTDFTRPSPQNQETVLYQRQRLARPYFFLAGALALVASAGLAPADLVPAPMLVPLSALPVMPKRSLKRCTRPPRSTLWRTPVQAGWVLGSISRRICWPSLPQVDFVSKDVPSVITTVIL